MKTYQIGAMIETEVGDGIVTKISPCKMSALSKCDDGFEYLIELYDKTSKWVSQDQIFEA
jgi:SH3-like domain-containing protein